MSGVESALQQIFNRDEPSTIDKERVARIRTRIDSALEVAKDDREFILGIQERYPTWLLTTINNERLR